MIEKTYAFGEMSEKALRSLGGALLYDNLHLSDIIDRSRSEEHKAAICKHIEENEFLIQRIRFELAERKRGNTNG